MTAVPDDTEFRDLVDGALVTFVAERRRALAPLGPELDRLADVAASFVAGGKRLRPLFCRAGWLVAGGAPDDARLVTAAAAWEWLQASALVHDDLIDGSDTRRGRPSVHRELEALHRAESRAGDPATFGEAGAVLLGDLLLSWCDHMLRSSADVPGAPDGTFDLDAAFRVLDLCKTEVVAGQYLDVAGQTRAELSADDAMTVVRYKSAKYTVERPLHLGAALAGADEALLGGLSAVALPLGEAFQLRDDVLGVFGDPAVTGKPAGDDLREGKRTLLVARTAELTDDAGRTLLASALGTTDGVGPVRDLIAASGALDAVEADIARLERQADAALEALGPHAVDVLRPLALTATRRSH